MQEKNEIEAQNRLSLFKQTIHSIEMQINNNFIDNELLFKLLGVIKENSEFIESILDESKDNEQLKHLAQAGKELLEELEQKIKAQNRNVAALLNGEFNKIRAYYSPFISKENTAVSYNNMPSQAMGGFSAERDIYANQTFNNNRTRTNTFVQSAVIHGFNSPAIVIPPLMPSADKLPEMWSVPQRNNRFTGREELLKKMTEYFSAKEAKHLVLTTHGLGGIGKTQLTLEYVWQNYQSYKGVCWFNAESRERLIIEYVNLGQVLHVFAEADKSTSSEEKAKIVKTWLEHPSRAGWLLVYDNALKQDDINNLLPVKEGKILITSRHTYWPQHQTMALGVFSLKEAQDYIKKIIGEQKFDEESANQLIKRLGFLPLAIAQACAYIQRRKISVSDYLDLYQKKHEILLAEQLLPQDEYQRSVGVTWNITLDQMLKETPESVELMYCCSHLHHEQIPENLVPYFFAGADDIEKKLKANTAISVAQEYSMINIDEQKQTFSTHSLVQQIIREQLIKEQKNIDYLSKGISALNQLYPYGKGQMIDFSLKRVLKPHFEKELKYLDKFLEKLTLLNNENEKQLVIEAQKNILLPVLIYLADAYGDLGGTKEQKALLERALYIKEAHYGKEHIEVAITLINLANAYGELGDALEQKALLERALYIQEAHYGKEHVAVARTLGNLANAYGELGDARKQKALLEGVLKIFEEHYGKEHPEVARTLINLANAYGELGDALEQKALLERTLYIQEAYYGKEHPEVARTLINLANAYGELGDALEQKALLERALYIQEAHYGKEHVAVARTLGNLANAYLFQGNAQKSKEVSERALSIYQSFHSNDHIRIGVILGNLGNAYGALGDVLKQKEVLEKALAIFEYKKNENHIQVAQTLANLSSVYKTLGNFIQQKNLLERALVIFEKHYGKNHPEVAKVMVNLANNYGEFKEFNKKKDLLEQAVNIFEDKYGKEHIELAKALGNLGNVYGALGNKDKQKELLERTLKIKEYHYEKNHFEVAITLFSLAAAYRDLGDKQKCKDLLERTLVINESHYGKSHPEVGLILLSLGFSHFQEEDYTKAKDYVQKAYTIFIRSPICGVNHPHTKEAKRLLDELNRKLPISKKEESFSGDLFKEISNKHASNVGNNQLEKLLKKYNILNSSQVNLEKGLRMAATNNQVEDLKEFINAGVNINAQDNNPQSRKTALHWAVIKQALPCIKKLLELGARFDIEDSNHKIARDYAKNINDNEIIKLFTITLNNYFVTKSISETGSGYNPTLFAREKSAFSALEILTRKEHTPLQSLLQKANTSITTHQNKKLVQIIFTDHKLVQEFADELHRINISNLNMKDEPRKPNVIVSDKDKEDEYIILLTADEYNTVMDSKEAYAKLINSQSQQFHISP